MAAVAGRLVVVVGLLAVILGLVWAIVLYGYRWSAARMDNWLARLLTGPTATPRWAAIPSACLIPSAVNRCRWRCWR